MNRELILLILLAHIALAQSGASISGVVKDPQGRSIPNASVMLFERASDQGRSATSDTAGAYRFQFLAPGNYLLQAEAPGFARFVTEDIQLSREATKTINIELPLAGLEQQVVVTASGTPQTAAEVSRATSVVDRADIEDRDEFAVSDALRFTPGLHVQQLGGPGAFVTIRTRGLRDQDTSVLIDGLRFRDPAATQADASGFLEDLLVTNLDRVEVLRGAGSALYGTNAIGGAINIVTDEGGGRIRGSILTEGGSLGLFRGKAQLAGGLLKDRLQYSAGFAHLNVTSGINGDDPARITSGQGRVGFRLSPAAQLIARVYAADSFLKVNTSPRSIGSIPATDIVDAIPLSLSELRRFENGAPVSDLVPGRATFIPSADDPDSTRAGRFVSGALILQGHAARGLGYSISYQDQATQRIYGDGPAGTGLFQPIGSTRSDFAGRIETMNARLDYQLGRFQLIDGGYEFENETFENRFLDRVNTAADSAVNVSERSHTLFIQDQLRLFDGRLQISGAFRVQRFSLSRPEFDPAASAPFRNASFASPPAAYTGDGSAAYFFRETGTKLRAHVGRGYRAPSLFERFGAGFDPDFGYSTFGDPRLRPERSTAVDAGIDQSFFNRRLITSATYFYTALDQVIIFDFSGAINPATDPFGRFGGYRNTQGGLARGVELSASLAPTRSLHLTAAYTYTNARERTPIVGDILRTFGIPNHQFSATAVQRFGKRLTVSFDLLASSNYLTPVFTNDARVYRFHGIKKADIAASYRIPISDARAVRLFGKVGNVFNQDYFESGFRTPGRTGTGGLQFEF
jgi:vitamin B12 transporter